MLTGDEIKKQVKKGGIVITPFAESRINPNSYNLRLSPHLKVYSKVLPLHEWWERTYREQSHLPLWRTMPLLEPLDMAVEEEAVDLFIPQEGLCLYPGVMYLGCTEEYTETHGFVPRLDGRSSVGRLGMCIHLTAAFGDIGFRGHWTLEITVVHPLVVYSGTRICQISYEEVTGHVEEYQGKYQGTVGPVPSRFHKEVASQRGKPDRS